MAISVLGAALGLAPLQSAAAADAPAPSIAFGISHSLDLWGPTQQLDITLGAPPTTDAYVRLEFFGADQNLRITDDAGNELPLGPGTGPYAVNYREVTVGAADSDGNGTKGAPLKPGIIRLHISAQYPVSDRIDMTALLMDGATDHVIADSGNGPEIFVAEPFLHQDWTNTSGGYEASLPVRVATGASRAVVQETHVQMNSAGTVPTPATHTRLVFTAQQLADAGYTAAQFVNDVSVARSSDGTHFTSASWTTAPDGSVSVDQPAIDWHALNINAASQYLSFRTVWGMPAGVLKGSLQILDADGRQYGGGPESLQFTADTRPAALQAAFYGRDAAGNLWQYRGNESVAATHTYYEQRDLVGGGWNTYTAMTAMAPLKADGTGDLVARDHDGVLWFYGGTGYLPRPFLSRVRVGGGWNTYNSLTGAGDLTGDGHADLLARDSAGVLWLYQGTGKPTAPFLPRARVGAGWNAYNVLTAAGDLTGDGHADLLARDTSGRLWMYRATGRASGPYAPRVQVGAGWQGYTHILGVGDLLADGHPDIIATDAAGSLWYYEGTGNPAAPYKPRLKIGASWSIYNTLL